MIRSNTVSYLLLTIQSLYEAKLLSYPRTDCTYSTDEEFDPDNIGIRLLEEDIENFELIEENRNKVNHYFQTVFRTFLRHKQYIKNALETDYSNAKLEATNKVD